MKRLSSFMLLFLMATSIHAVAQTVSVDAARETANAFIKTHAKSRPGSLRAPAMADILLSHAEKSGKVADANCYYIFNIKGGGFIIISGDRRATPVLAYSDNGQINMNNIPDPLQDLLEIYKNDVDYLFTHKISSSNSYKQTLRESVNIVDPMLKTAWGQEEPYNILCPTLNGAYSKTGCSAVAMAQTVKFWQFPASCDTIPSYYSPKLQDTVPAFPATVFDFEKMLPSYCHWDLENQQIIQDSYSDEQALEVAKLLRYCGQSVQMNYSPSSSSPQSKRPAAMKAMGYNSNAHTIYRKYYTDDKWISLIKTDLDSGIPVMYTAYNKGSDVGHVFILDGYDSEDYFHINFGWYGHSNGWYQISAIVLTYLDGTARNYIGNNSFIIGLEPPLFCTINTEVTADQDLLLLGSTFNPQAIDVDLSMSYRTLPFMFSLTDEQGNEVALSESITLNRLSFENHSDISLPLTLPETLPSGVYNLNLNYRRSETKPLTMVATAQAQLTVVGRFAKYGKPFAIADVVLAIDYVLNGSPSGIDVGIDDVTALIDHLIDR